MDGCLTTPQHTVYISYWVSDKRYQPVGCVTVERKFLIDVDFLLGDSDELVLHPIRSNDTGAGDGFTEVTVDRGAGLGLQSLQLAGGGNIKSLEITKRRKCFM